MNTEEKGTLDTLVQEQIDTDTDFQDSLVDLSDEDKETAVSDKRAEVREQEFKSLSESSDKNKELAGNYKVRAEKAEGKIPKEKEVEEAPKAPQKDSDLSTKDLYSLMTAEVPQEDVDEVIKASKLLGKTIDEALQDPTVKVILDNRQEERKTAEASNTKTARPSTKKASGQELLKNLSEGKVPEKGSDDAEELFWAKRGGKR